MSAASALVAIRCSDPTPTPVDCTPRPAFNVTVTAADDPLPMDLVLSVRHGGGCERFFLRDQGMTMPCTPEDEEGAVFCDAPVPDAGLMPAHPRLLRCALWTEGAATLQLESTEYPPVDRVLEADADECGFRTVDVNIDLTEADAGS